ncbi:MAG: ATP-dependent helicase HrpB [Acidobacteriota bacterium]
MPGTDPKPPKPRTSPGRRPAETLPVDAVLPRIVTALEERPNLVLRADTGAGKTTRVPPALVDAGLGRVVVLEPRRVAARAAARRIADERGWRLGEEVGYQVRFDRRASEDTRLLVVTEGILITLLQRDPFLDGVGALVFDELHERSLAADLSIAMARKVQREARPDLRIVAMSATLDAGPVAEFLGGDALCTTLDSEGRRFPVSVEYLPQADPRGVPTLVREAVQALIPDVRGDILVFLPGVGEIHRCREFLEPVVAAAGVDLVPLFGDLPPDQQDAVLRPGRRRRVVLATNVAETSVTLAGIAAVVDSGQVRRLRYDPGLGLDRLELGKVSRASAEQRRGRAGRLGPGRCLRLWTEIDDRTLQDREQPEIQRVDLTAPVLELLAWGETDLRGFPWLEPPDPAAVDRALELLTALGALRQGKLTKLGRTLARLPVHPRLGRLMVEGHRLGQPRRAARLAALLSERNLVSRSVGRRPVVAMASTPSDPLDRLEALESFEATGYGDTVLGPVHPERSRHVLRVARQLEASARERLENTDRDSGPGAMDPEEAILRAVLAAYPDRVARRREAGSRRALMVGGRGIRLAEMSSVHGAELFVAVELDAGRGGERREALVRQASSVQADWLGTLERRTEAYFDPERKRVLGLRRTLYGDLAVAETDADPGPDRAAALLAEVAAEDPGAALPLDDPAVASMLGRLRSLAHWRPDLDLPTYEGEQLRQLASMLAVGKRSFDELRRAPLLDVLIGDLGYRRLGQLDSLAPERLEVPSGSRIRLAYGAGDPPVLAVRIQEMFGLDETPAVAGGRVKVLLHLLAPNGRPQQVTQDLPSFWRNVYPEVRKELAGRYPKHPWPEDPLGAEPTRRTKGRRRS